MTTMKIAGRLPDGTANGLTAARDRLLKDPDGLVACYVLLDVKSITNDRDTDEDIPLPRIRHIEAVEDYEARELARRLVERRERRLGRPMRHLDLGDDLVALLGIDSETGEITDPGNGS